MIDEKKLIEVIKSVKNTMVEMNKKVVLVDAMKMFPLFVELVESQPKVGEWISCSERLPNDNEKSDYYDAVIVTLDNGRVVNGCYINRDKEWWVDAEDGEKYSINVTGNVIAWMPLPAPYKEDM